MRFRADNEQLARHLKQPDRYGEEIIDRRLIGAHRVHNPIFPDIVEYVSAKEETVRSPFLTSLALSISNVLETFVFTSRMTQPLDPLFKLGIVAFS